MSAPDTGSATWPDSAHALVDTQSCPSCFHRLTEMTCTHCGLVVADPRAARLLELGRSMLLLEAERQRVIGEIRLAYQPTPVAAPVLGPVPEWAAYPPPAASSRLIELPDRDPVHAEWPVEASDSLAAAVEASDSTAPSAVEAADALAAGVEASDSLAAAVEASDATVPPAVEAPVARPAPRRRRLTVPVLLLIVGVSLVGIAAVFFLILAWTVADIGMKSLIIGGVTLTTMVVASLLRRWSLTATAEGIGALGVILLALDCWAVRANDLFGSESLDAVVYAGVVTLAIGVVCRTWSVISRLRGPDLAATLALPTGLGLLAAGLLPLETSAAVTAGLLGTAAGGLAHALPAPWSAAREGRDSVPERTALMAIGMASLVVGAGTTLFLGLESMTVQLVAAATVIILSVAYALLLRPRRDVEPLPGSVALRVAASALAAGFTASLGWQMAAQSELPIYAGLLAPVIAVVIAVALDRWQPPGLALNAPRIAAALVAGPSVLLLVAMSVTRAAESIRGEWTLWNSAVFTPPPGSDTEVAMFAAIGTAVIAVLLFLAPTLERPALRDVRPIAAALIVLAGVLGTGTPIVIVSAAIAIAAVSLLALAGGANPVGWGTAAGIGTLTAFLAGLAAPWLWAVAVLVAIAVPIIARAAARPGPIAAILLALAPVLVCAVAAFVGPSAIGAALDVEVDARAALALVSWVALGTLVCAICLRIDAASQTALAFSAYALFLVSLLAFVVGPAAESSVSTAISEPALAIVRAGGLLIVLAIVGLLWTRIDVWASLGAAALVAPAAAGLGIAVLATFHPADDGWPAFTTVAAAAVVVWAGALIPSRAYAAFSAFGAEVPSRSADPVFGTDAAGRSADAAQAAAVGPHPPVEARARAEVPTLVRRAADIGALATALMGLGWQVPEGMSWAVLVVGALGFAGAAVTRGWAAPVDARPSGVPETASAGSPLAGAPRRLLAWPAVAAATLAWWSWLDGSGSHEIEAFVLPPAIALLLFAAALVWLRRRAEATIAVAIGFGLGLVVPAIIGTGISGFGISGFGISPTGDSPVRGTVVAIAASALTLALSWTPIRRVRTPALAGAAVALVALGIVAVDRASTDTEATGWLLLLVGAAYASAFGFVRGSHVPSAPPAAPAPAPNPPAETVFAAVAPPIALAVGVLAAVPSLGEASVVAVALGLTGALHLTAAVWDRLPLGGAKRWTALAGAVVAAAGAILTGHIGAVEAVTIPVAAMLLGGAALAMWRRSRTGRPWPGAERVAWLAGIVVAVAPSVAAQPNDVRTWLVIAAALLGALECVVVPIADSRGLKTPSAILLTVGGLAMGMRALIDPAVDPGAFAALTAGAGALVVAAVMVWMIETDAPPPAATGLAAAGAALILAAVVVQSDGETVQATLTAIVGGAIGLGGAALLRWLRWSHLGAVLAVAGAIAASIATGSRFVEVVAGAGPSLEADLWATAGVGIVAAIGVMAIRSTASRSVALIVGATFSIVLALFTAAQTLQLAGADPDELRTALTMSALTVVGVVAVIWHERLGVLLGVAAAGLALLFGVIALAIFDVRPVELVTVPPALGMIVLGARALLRDPAARTWPTLGPGLALLTVPSLVYDFTIPPLVGDFGSPALWRVVALGIVSVGLVVAGVVWRLQAPLVLGSVVLLVHALAQLWPWISDMYVAVPWWLWLGIGGALLIVLAARYERRVRNLRAAFTAVTSLR